MNSLFTVVLVIGLFIMFGGVLKTLVNSLVNALVPLAKSLEIYSESVEKKTQLHTKRDVAKLEAQVKKDLQKVNEERSKVDLPEIE